MVVYKKITRKDPLHRGDEWNGIGGWTKFNFTTNPLEDVPLEGESHETFCNRTHGAPIYMLKIRRPIQYRSGMKITKKEPK